MDGEDRGKERRGNGSRERERVEGWRMGGGRENGWLGKRGDDSDGAVHGMNRPPLPLSLFFLLSGFMFSRLLVIFICIMNFKGERCLEGQLEERRKQSESGLLTRS